jgi:hypothetical protein
MIYVGYVWVRGTGNAAAQSYSTATPLGVASGGAAVGRPQMEVG